MAIQSKQTKVSGSTAGETMHMKKDGYASGSVPSMARAAKVGKTNRKGYSGPNVAVPDANSL